MLNVTNTTMLCKKQPLFFSWLQSEARRELAWNEEDNRQKGAEFSRFHEKIYEKQILEGMTSSTFAADLQMLALFTLADTNAQA